MNRRKHRNMFQDAKGRWWLDYYTPDGKRRRKIAGKTKGEADRLLRTIRTSVDRGEYVDGSGAPGFSAFTDTFMARHGQHKVSYVRSFYVIVRLKKFFGHMKLSKITAGHVEEYRLARLADTKRDGKSPLSRTSINREVETLRAMLAMAVKWGYVTRNVTASVSDYDEDNTRDRFLTTEQRCTLLRATKRSSSPLLRPAVYLALETGMRKSELLRLRWSDVNFEASQILVRDTKSGLPRQVPMSRRARWVLQKLAARNPLAAFVFEVNGKAVLDVKTAWCRALRIARIEDFRFHDLRHSFASTFAMKNGNLYALAKILGHANPKITMDRYAHLSPEFINQQRHIMDAPYIDKRA